MKRAKLILAAIAVVAIAGGVFASKAKRQNDFVYTRSTPTTTICSVKLPVYTTNPGGLFYTSTYATTIQSAVCTLTLPVYHGE